MEETEGPLLIKRYASRRLYNTESSDYVTLQEVAGLIRSGRDVKIVDRKSGDDLTRQYLIQIIAEHEANGEQLLPINVLTEVVRSYNDKAQELVPEFLSASFDALRQSQSQFMNNWKSMSQPMTALDEFRRGQQEFFANMLGGWTAGGSGSATAKGAAEDDADTSELDEIKRQLAELQSKVSKL